MRLLRQIYRYFKYYRYDIYVSSKWLQDFDRGDKDNLIIH